MLKTGSGKNIVHTVTDLFAKALILVMFALLAQSCVISSIKRPTDRIPSDPYFVTVNGIKYGCLEYRAFTAVLQTADSL